MNTTHPTQWQYLTGINNNIKQRQIGPRTCLLQMFKSLCPPPGTYFCVWNGLGKNDWHCYCFKQSAGIMTWLRSLNVHLRSTSHLLQLGQKKHAWKQKNKLSLEKHMQHIVLLYMVLLPPSPPHPQLFPIMEKCPWIPLMPHPTIPSKKRMSPGPSVQPR